jgi:hypothetical protein
MGKSFADIEQDLRFQLDLVKLTEALRCSAPNSADAPEKYSGAMEELVRVHRRKQPDHTFNG